MKTWWRLAGVALAAFALVWTVSGPAHAADEGEVLRLRAAQLAAEQRFEEALVLARRARRASPSDARAAVLEGQCAIGLGRYADALAPLQAARDLDPALAEAGLHLGIAHYHLDELDAAEPLLNEAAQRRPDSAQAQLYRGMMDLRRARANDAAGALERAAALDPGATEPVASYYAGLAWREADEIERSEQRLRRVIDQAPGSPWAQQAERLLGDTRAGDLRRWFVGTAGGEYDDNVVLRGRGVQLPGEISSGSDWRWVWELEAGAELLRTRDWGAGVILGYGGSKHQDLDDFDVHYPSFSAWVDRRLSEQSFLRFQPDVGYAWVDDDPYLSTYGANLELHHDWERAGTGRAFVRLARHNYLFTVPVLPLGPGGADVSSERNRDGTELVTGYDHSFGLGDDTLLRGGMRVHRYDAHGSEYSYQGYQAWVGGRRELPWDFALDVYGSYTYKPYSSDTTYPDPGTTRFEGGRRHDDVWQVAVAIERPLTDHVKLEARWRYEDNDSNVAVFDYRRDVVGAYVTVGFGR